MQYKAIVTIRIFFRKTFTLLNILQRPDALPVLSERLSQNARELLLKLKGNKPFPYKQSLGFPFICIPESSTSVHIFIQNDYAEKLEANLSLSWLNEGDTCVDIGANVGYFTALFAHCVGSSGQVVSVEASPKTIQHLTNLVDLLSLGQVKVKHACITDGSQQFIEFYIHNEKSSDLMQSLFPSLDTRGNYTPVQVESISIEQLSKMYHLTNQVSLVKIDIEGAEPIALSNSSSLIKTSSPPLVIIEVAENALKRQTCTTHDILKYFPSEVYDLFVSNISYPNSTPDIEIGYLYPLANLTSTKLPWLFNLIALPKSGKFSDRKAQISSHLFK